MQGDRGGSSWVKRAYIVWGMCWDGYVDRYEAPRGRCKGWGDVCGVWRGLIVHFQFEEY